jgi:hypothetical protein
MSHASLSLSLSCPATGLEAFMYDGVTQSNGDPPCVCCIIDSLGHTA